MQQGETHIGSEAFGPWTLTYFQTPGEGSHRASSVEVSHGDKRKARLTLVVPALDLAEVRIRLRERADLWIADYENRHQDGHTTGFGEL